VMGTVKRLHVMHLASYTFQGGETTSGFMISSLLPSHLFRREPFIIFPRPPVSGLTIYSFPAFTPTSAITFLSLKQRWRAALLSPLPTFQHFNFHRKYSCPTRPTTNRWHAIHVHMHSHTHTHTPEGSP